MSFDCIEVRMALKAPMKLATGKQEVVWVQRDKHKKNCASIISISGSKGL